MFQNWKNSNGYIFFKNKSGVFLKSICLTSLARAKPKEKMEFPA